MKYEVKIYCANPRNNLTISCESLNEAKTRIKNYESDDPGDCAKLLRDGECIAFRDLNKKNLTWMNSTSEAAAALGRITSEKKKASSKKNAKKGGWPKGRPRK
jgi:hypothetical protein